MSTLRSNLIRLANDLPKGKNRSAVLDLVAGDPMRDLKRSKDKAVSKLRDLTSRVTYNIPSEALDDLAKLTDAVVEARDSLGYYLTTYDGDEDVEEKLEELSDALQDVDDYIDTAYEVVQGFIDDGAEDDDPEATETIEDMVSDIERSIDEMDRIKLR